MNDPYTITEQNDQLILRTVLYRHGSGSALNAMVYNRELAAILSACGASAVFYVIAFRSIASGWILWTLLGAAFLVLYGLLRRTVFVEHTTVSTLDKLSGTVIVSRERALGRTLTKLIRMAEIRFIEAVEQPAPDESDIQEIVKWHKMAEPGVHSTPIPVYRVSFVLNDGSHVLVYTDVVLDRAQAVRKRLAEFIGLA